MFDINIIDGKKTMNLEYKLIGLKYMIAQYLFG